MRFLLSRINFAIVSNLLSTEYDLNLFFLVRADTHAHALRIGRDDLRIKVYQVTKYGIDRHGVIRNYEDVHGCRSSRPGTVALHRHDSVHDMESRLRTPVNVREHPRKHSVIRELHMPRCLPVTTDKTINILDRTRDPLKCVGLHLTNVYDGIALNYFLAEVKFLAGHTFREINMLGIRHGRHASSETLFINPKHPECALARSVSRRIAVLDIRASCLVQQPKYCFSH